MHYAIFFIITTGSFILLTYGIIFFRQRKIRYLQKGLEEQIRKQFTQLSALLQALNESTIEYTEYTKPLTAIVHKYLASKTLNDMAAAAMKASRYMNQHIRKKEIGFHTAAMRNINMELIATEQKINFSYQFYNRAVTSFNQFLQFWPVGIVAGIFNIHGENPLKL